jgi:hypothetical protein
MSAIEESICPGCGLRMPISANASYDGYYNTSAECWGVYSEVLGTEYSNALLFRKIHQLTMDTYAVQHAGGPHPDKSIAIHLCGLHLVLEQDFPVPKAPQILKCLADTVKIWPHFPPPGKRGSLTVIDVALCDTVSEHIQMVNNWASAVWEAWSPHHPAVEVFINKHLDNHWKG